MKKRYVLVLLVVFGLLLSFLGAGGAWRHALGDLYDAGHCIVRYDFNDGDTWESSIRWPDVLPNKTYYNYSIT